MSIRILVTVVLLHPLSNVSTTIYSNFIKPFLYENEKKIDDKLDELAKEGKKKLIDGAGEVLKNLWFYVIKITVKYQDIISVKYQRYVKIN